MSNKNTQLLDINCFSNIKAKIKEFIGIDLIYCPVGKFIMGCTENELEWTKYSREREIQHEVEIKFPFLLGKFPVTSIQYAYLMLNNKTWLKGSLDPEVDSAYPAMNLNYLKSKSFCDKLNDRFSQIIPSGYKFDLPSSEQWEYACRAGTTSALNNGKELTAPTSGICENLDEVAWYAGNSEDILKPVGFKKPNSWGFYDMHGNIREWCSDLNNDESRPHNERIMRNSCFCYGFREEFISSYFRYTDEDDFDYDGFRLALTKIANN